MIERLRDTDKRDIENLFIIFQFSFPGCARKEENKQGENDTEKIVTHDLTLLYC